MIRISIVKISKKIRCFSITEQEQLWATGERISSWREKKSGWWSRWIQSHKKSNQSCGSVEEKKPRRKDERSGFCCNRRRVVGGIHNVDIVDNILLMESSWPWWAQ